MKTRGCQADHCCSVFLVSIVEVANVSERNLNAQGQEQLVAVDKGKLNSPKVEEGLARVLFHPSSEAAINEQINHELTMR